MSDIKPKSNNSYGGQALIEGIMIRGKVTSVLVAKPPDGPLIKKEIPFTKFYSPKYMKIPILRGILMLIDTLVVGTKALNFSAEVAEGNISSQDDINEQKGISLALVITFSLVFAISIFFMAPALISRFFNQFGINDIYISVIEGIIRLVFVIGYIYLISLSKDIRRVFQYHGAEHMAVATHESGEELTINNVKSHNKEHPRCGTSFLLLVVMVSIVVFMLFPRDNLILFIISRIIFVPIIAGISYELLKLGSKSRFKFVTNILNGPGILIQKITTKKPDDSQIEVAIESMKYAIELNES